MRKMGEHWVGGTLHDSQPNHTQPNPLASSSGSAAAAAPHADFFSSISYDIFGRVNGLFPCPVIRSRSLTVDDTVRRARALCHVIGAMFRLGGTLARAQTTLAPAALARCTGIRRPSASSLYRPASMALSTSTAVAPDDPKKVRNIGTWAWLYMSALNSRAHAPGLKTGFSRLVPHSPPTSHHRARRPRQDDSW